MSMKTLEREILAELKTITGNNKLKMKDIMEWSTGEIKALPGEKFAHLPELKVNVAYVEKKA